MKIARQVTLRRARELRRNLTDAETILWSRLRGDALGLRFRRQRPIGSYIADFACVRARLVVEVDGSTHGSDGERQYDAERDHFMRSHGWCVIRIRNGDVYDDLDRVLDHISSVANTRVGALGSASRT